MSDIASSIFVYIITRESCIKAPILVRGWCLAISRESKSQIRVFPLRYPDTSYLNVIFTHSHKCAQITLSQIVIIIPDLYKVI